MPKKGGNKGPIKLCCQRRGEIPLSPSPFSELQSVVSPKVSVAPSNLTFAAVRSSRKMARQEAPDLPTFSGFQTEFYRNGGRTRSLVSEELPLRT